MQVVSKVEGERPRSVLHESDESNRAILNSLLVALKTRDADTYDHSKRTVCISLLLGQECGLDQRQMRSLKLGALLHDIGKIGVPDAVLRKPTKLNDIDWAMMRRHPHLGQAILQGLNFLENARIIVAQHHEKWDGSGYPLGLRGEEIDLSARIIFVADAFDAMTSDRVYRSARSYKTAVAELDSCAGTHFDPGVVSAFHRLPQMACELIARRASLLPLSNIEPATWVGAKH